jgi:hypothetical protein
VLHERELLLVHIVNAAPAEFLFSCSGLGFLSGVTEFYRQKIPMARVQGRSYDDG